MAIFKATAKQARKNEKKEIIQLLVTTFQNLQYPGNEQNLKTNALISFKPPYAKVCPDVTRWDKLVGDLYHSQEHKYSSSFISII